MNDEDPITTRELLEDLTEPSVLETETSPPLPPAARYNPMWYVWAVSLIAAIGGLLFGYDFVVIGGAKPFFEKYFQLNSQWLSGWANSCALLGCLLGALTSGGLSDKFGRKKLLLVAAFLFASSSALTGWAPTFSWFVVWRMLGGVAIGITSNVAPVYIAEVAPAHLRGRLVAIYQLAIFLGFVVGQTLNWLIAETMRTTPPRSLSASPGTASTAGGGCSRRFPRRRWCSSLPG